LSQTFKYGLRTANGTAGALAGVNVESAPACPPRTARIAVEANLTNFMTLGICDKVF
jgi:hypothetical protein